MTRKKEVPMPMSVTVAHRTIAIELLSITDAELAGVYACYGDADSVIKMKVGMPLSLTRECLLHEVIHAVYRIYGIQADDEEERIVNTLGVGLLKVMDDNPKLMKYLGDK